MPYLKPKKQITSGVKAIPIKDVPHKKTINVNGKISKIDIKKTLKILLFCLTVLKTLNSSKAMPCIVVFFATQKVPKVKPIIKTIAKIITK